MDFLIDLIYDIRSLADGGFNWLFMVVIVFVLWQDFTHPKKKRTATQGRTAQTADSDIEIPELFSGKEYSQTEEEQINNDCALSTCLDTEVKRQHRHHTSLKNLERESTVAAAPEKRQLPLPENSLARGIVLASVLGKPRALRPLEEEQY